MATPNTTLDEMLPHFDDTQAIRLGFQRADPSPAPDTMSSYDEILMFTAEEVDSAEWRQDDGLWPGSLSTRSSDDLDDLLEVSPRIPYSQPSLFDEQDLPDSPSDEFPSELSPSVTAEFEKLPGLESMRGVHAHRVSGPGRRSATRPPLRHARDQVARAPEPSLTPTDHVVRPRGALVASLMATTNRVDAYQVCDSYTIARRERERREQRARVTRLAWMLVLCAAATGALLYVNA